MARYRFNIDLKEAEFPLVSALKESTVLVPGFDLEPNKPVIYWAENLIPTARGLSTPAIQDITFDDINIIDPEDIPERVKLYVVTGHLAYTTYLLIYDNYHYLFDINTGEWVLIATLVNYLDVGTSVFFLKGLTYVFHPGLGLKSINSTASGYTNESLNGLVVTNIKSMTAAVSYIVAVDTEGVFYWSSPLTPTEFDPTATGNGAGAGNSRALPFKGYANFVVPTAKGCAIYTSQNVIDVQYSGNFANPWRFTEVLNSSGVYFRHHVSFDNNASLHFAWSDTGLVNIQGPMANPVFPEVSDFLTGTIYEVFNKDTGLLDSTYVEALEVRTAFVAGRYLVVSYGLISKPKEYMLVLDTLLNRWGRIREPHLDIQNLNFPQQTSIIYNDDLLDVTYDEMMLISNRSLQPRSPESNFRSAKFAAITPTGRIKEIDLSNQEIGDTEGIMFYGDLALTRTRLSELSEVQIEGIYGNVQASVRYEQSNGVWTDWQGITFYPQVNRYLTDKVGQRHELRLRGPMHLSTVTALVIPRGSN
jgi:hypothetical protein